MSLTHLSSNTRLSSHHADCWPRLSPIPTQKRSACPLFIVCHFILHPNCSTAYCRTVHPLLPTSCATTPSVCPLWHARVVNGTECKRRSSKYVDFFFDELQPLMLIANSAHHSAEVEKQLDITLRNWAPLTSTFTSYIGLSHSSLVVRQSPCARTSPMKST
jgi:hypothetical protein